MIKENEFQVRMAVRPGRGREFFPVLRLCFRGPASTVIAKQLHVHVDACWGGQAGSKDFRRVRGAKPWGGRYACVAEAWLESMVEITTLSELTIDGKLSLGPGASSKDLFEFYGDELRTWFHQQRALHDAIMVGAGTVRSDDPELTVRHFDGPNPLRVVPCSTGDLPLGSRLLNDGGATLVAVSDRATDTAVARLTAKPNVEVVRCGADSVDLPQLMRLLDARGVRTMIAEGGSRLLHSLFEADLVSKIIIKHIPVISGAADAPSYLRSRNGASRLSLSRWRLDEWFVRSGVGVSVYAPLGAAA